MLMVSGAVQLNYKCSLDNVNLDSKYGLTCLQPIIKRVIYGLNACRRQFRNFLVYLVDVSDNTAF